MRYVHIPVAFESPRKEQFDAFLDAMDQAQGKRVFLHCAANYRASSFANLYGIKRSDWDMELAGAYLKKIWDPDPVWRAFMDSILETKD